MVDIEHIILNEDEFKEILNIYEAYIIPFIMIVNKQG